MRNRSDRATRVGLCGPAITLLITLGGTQTMAESAKPTEGSIASGSSDTVRFAVAWSTQSDPAAAGKRATEAAVKALGCPAKAVVFYTYYQDPGFVPDDAAQHTAVKADVQAEQAAAKAVAQACGAAPNIGCRAQCLTNGGTLLKNAVCVLAVGGEKASVAVAAAPILDNRRETGERLAAAMKEVKDLNLILALAEMRLSFEAKEGVSVEDFIRGVLDGAPADVTLFGGNSMPDDMAAKDLAGAQFHNGKALKGHVVALGVGGPVASFANHTNEFRPSEQTVAVTETKDKWVVSFDGKPAEEVYRGVRGMKPDEALTSDWQHPVGVVVADGKVYTRMILNWVAEEGKDKDGKPVDVPKGSLCFVAPVVKGTQVKVLGGGDNARAIVASAEEGIRETIREAKEADAQPVLALVSDCCARGMRLRTFRKGNDDEVTEAVLPAMGTEIPLFGFYAWGELGRIKGQYRNMCHQYQQHTFVTTVVGLRE